MQRTQRPVNSGAFKRIMEVFVFSLFCLILIVCIAMNVSIVLALLLGLAVFLIYGKFRGYSLVNLAQMCLSGIKTVHSILITFLLIGMLTAIWRASGCIPSIVSYASGLISPSIFLLLTFLLCALVSVLTGTSFGSAATMGVICASIAGSMLLPPLWIGGAVLGGVYFGDRCSPVSTSALLVSTLTKTEIYTNIRQMIRSSIVPFFLTCLIYLAVGFTLPGAQSTMDVRAMFEKEFVIHPICLLPAGIIIVLAFFKIRVKQLMLISIATALPIALVLQHSSLIGLLRAILTGYEAQDPALSSMISGGGLTSMLRVAAIVCIASCYSGIFRETGLLNFLTKVIDRVSSKFGVYLTMLLISLPIGAISCNQTLTIMLSHQLTEHLEETPERRANFLEDSAVVIAPLIPWSIAGSVPLATVGAPTISILCACYLYLLPLWHALISFLELTRKEKTHGTKV